MRIGIVINARCGSKRLPDKHFADINGKPALKWLLDRLPKQNVFIATGPREQNERFEWFKIPVFYGSPDNIPLRHLQLAEKYMLDAILSIDGDDLLMSRKAIDDGLKYLQHCDLIRTEGLSLGMNVLWGYKVTTLKKALSMGINAKMANDTGWGWIFDEMPITYIQYTPVEGDKLRLTLDTPDDLEMFRKIFKDCPREFLHADKMMTSWIIAQDFIK